MKYLPDFWRGAIVPKGLVSEMSRMQAEMDRLFDSFVGMPADLGKPLTGSLIKVDFIPSRDIEETDKNYLLKLDLPGVKKDKVKIEMNEHRLTITGERQEEREEKTDKRFERERFYGSFARSFELPAAATADKAEALYENGVLTITVPKAALAESKKIPIMEKSLLAEKKAA